MGREKAVRRKRSKLIPEQQNRWTLVLDSREAAVNLYSILLAFYHSRSEGLVDREGARYIAKWLRDISDRVPEVRELADDSSGPFRERDLSPIDVSLKLDSEERALMLSICRLIHSQLTTPEARRNWIENQGRSDYEMAVKNFRSWVASLEGKSEPADI